MTAVAYAYDQGIRPHLAQERVSRRAKRARVPQRAPMATYRRRRLGVAMLATSVLLVAGVVLGRLGTGPLAGSETSHSGLIAQTSYVVKSGDTDWSIAQSLHPRGDIRPLVDYLYKQHADQPLQVGEVLRLP
jgi:hypothetical protein